LVDGGATVAAPGPKKCRPGYFKVKQPQYRAKGAAKKPARYACVPIIAPPQTIVTVQRTRWDLAIHDYKTKRKIMLGKDLAAKIDRISYLGSKEKFTAAEKALFAKFMKTQEHKRLVEMVKGLFEKTFRFDKAQGKITKIDQTSRKALSSLLDLAQKEEVADPWVRYYVRLNNQDLQKGDLELLLAFEEGSPTQRRKAWGKIALRLKKVAIGTLAAYDKTKGTANPEKSVHAKRLEALRWFLDMSKGFDVKAQRIVNRVLYNASKHVLDSFPQSKWIIRGYRQARARFLRNPSSMARRRLAIAKKNIFGLLLFFNQRFAISPYQSKNRTHFFGLKVALYYAAIASGITEKELTASLFKNALPLPKDPKKRVKFIKSFISSFAHFSYISNSPEKIDNYKVRSFYKKTLKGMVANYLNCKVYERCAALGAHMHALLSFQRKMGVSSSEIDRILKPLIPQVRSQKLTLTAIASSKVPINVRPQDLPDKVIAVLKNTGQWKKVCLARRIAFVPSIHQGKLGKGSIVAAGHASLAGVVTINSTVFTNPEDIALVLVHEATHIEDMKRNPKTLSTQTERNAYLAEYKAGKKILERMISKRMPRKKIERMADLLTHSRAKVEYANKVLGYPANDFSERSDLPKGPNMDYSYYPIFAGYRRDKLSRAVNFLGFNAKGHLKKIMSGNSTITGKIVFEKNKKRGLSVKKLDINLDQKHPMSKFIQALRKKDEKYIFYCLGRTKKTGRLSFKWQFGRRELLHLLKMVRLKRIAQKEMHLARGKVLEKIDKPLIPIPF